MWLLVVICLLCVWLRHRFPLTTAMAALLAFTFACAAQMTLLATGITVAVTTYILGNQRSRKVTYIWGILATTAITALSFSAGKGSSLDPTIFQFAAVVAISAALGDSSRSRRQHLRSVTERAERAERTREAEAHRAVAEERLRIAHDLHDVVAHKISVISLNAGVASSAIDSNPTKAPEALATIRKASRSVLGDIGELMQYLRRQDSTDPGAGARLRPLPGMGEISDLIDSMRKSGLSVNYHVDASETPDMPFTSELRSATQTVAYRVIQEGLTNAPKYGTGTANIDMTRKKDSVEITIINEVTAASTTKSPSTGWGLRGLQERTQAVGGTMTTRHTSTQFIFVAELPVSHDSI
ncbi:sensor histidine kinase [Actinomycetaceae bacterium WB03_NA08]|uniref:histidine kinase n=1 Tax=Scrofimicrobium canadense TaxID=2652290 RepID=A0A6N7VRY0_9ACTO|nr:histidine kinase [Scrofimicrobium canadense]MSS83710.1 sensor histidine kinase [Scrofimicrobium canadense]